MPHHWDKLRVEEIIIKSGCAGRSCSRLLCFETSAARYRTNDQKGFLA